MDLQKRRGFKVMFLTDLSILFLQSSCICGIIKIHYFKCLTSKIRQELTQQVSSTCTGLGTRKAAGRRCCTCATKGIWMLFLIAHQDKHLFYSLVLQIINYTSED